VRVAVLVSGSGTNLEAMLERGVPVTLVIADRPCDALAIATDHGVRAQLCDRAEFGGFSRSFDRDAYTGELTEVLSAAGVDLVAMAGFGTILSRSFHEAFPGRVLNTHPSLLPAFPGWHSVADALEAGVKVTGCTVHLAALEVDAGPILAQEPVPVLKGDTVETLHERIKVVEHRLYPETVLEVLAELEAATSAAAGVGAETKEEPHP
jgi:phosphoribosylglycinamide formyltransferase 1